MKKLCVIALALVLFITFTKLPVCAQPNPGGAALIGIKLLEGLFSGSGKDKKESSDKVSIKGKEFYTYNDWVSPNVKNYVVTEQKKAKGRDIKFGEVKESKVMYPWLLSAYEGKVNENKGMIILTFRIWDDENTVDLLATSPLQGKGYQLYVDDKEEVYSQIMSQVRKNLASQKVSESSGSSKEESALDILKIRYAKGEITKEEFDRMKEDLK